jgi:hypothetical protein
MGDISFALPASFALFFNVCSGRGRMDAKREVSNGIVSGLPRHVARPTFVSSRCAEWTALLVAEY